MSDTPVREWNGGDTFPSGPLLRDQIAYHLRKSWELANGVARDAAGNVITDREAIVTSTTWHHEQAAIMATVYAAELNAPVELIQEAPTLTLMPLQLGLGDEIVGEVHTAP